MLSLKQAVNTPARMKARLAEPHLKLNMALDLEKETN